MRAGVTVHKEELVPYGEHAYVEHVILALDKNGRQCKFRAKSRPRLHLPNRLGGYVGASFGWIHRCTGVIVFVAEGDLCHYCEEGWGGAICRHDDRKMTCWECNTTWWKRLQWRWRNWRRKARERKARRFRGGLVQ